MRFCEFDGLVKGVGEGFRPFGGASFPFRFGIFPFRFGTFPFRFGTSSASRGRETIVSGPRDDRLRAARRSSQGRETLAFSEIGTET